MQPAATIRGGWVPSRKPMPSPDESEPAPTKLPLGARPTLAPELVRSQPAVRSRRKRAGRSRPSGGPPIHRLRDLSGRNRFLLYGALVLALLPAGWSAFHAVRNGYTPMGDNALIGLRASDVFTMKTPLVGQPSTSDRYGGPATSHPGPMPFWALSVPFKLLGPAVGLVVGASIINALAIAGVWFVAYRREGVVLTLWSLLLLTVLIWGLGANFLHDSLSSNVATYMVVLLFFLVWSVAMGDLALLPLTAIVVSFVFQAHLSVLGQNALFVALGAVALAWLVAGCRRRPERWRQYRRWLQGWLGWSFVAVAVLWSPVIAQQFTGDPGNVGEILKSYSYNTGHAHGVGWALDRALTGLGPVPIFARTAVRTDSLAYLTSPTGFGRALAVLPLLVLLGLAYLAWQRGARRALMLALTALAALASGFYSSVSLPEKGQPELKASAVRWMWMSGLFVWLSIGWLLWTLVPRQRRRKATAAGGVLLLCSLLVMSGVAASTARLPERDSVYFAPVSKALPVLNAQLKPGAYALLLTGFDAGLTVGPAVALDVVDHGHQTYTQRYFELAFGPARTLGPGHKVVGSIWVVDAATDPPGPGARMIAVIPRLDADVLRNVGPPYASITAALARSGGPKLTTKGRELAKTKGSSGTSQDRAISVLLDDPTGLVITGLIGPAVVNGYVEDFGVDDLTFALLKANVDGSSVTPYVSLWLGPPSNADIG